MNTVPPMAAEQLELLETASPLAKWLAEAAWAYTQVKGDPYFTRDEKVALAAYRNRYPDDPAVAGVRLAGDKYFK